MGETTVVQPGKEPRKFRGLRGMFAFTIVSVGQFFSLLGTTASSMALGIWAYQTSGLATASAMIGFFAMGAMLGFSPVAGALIDRWNRKLVMMLSDIGAGLTTVAVIILFYSGALQVWQLCITAGIAGLFQAFQFPAYSAAVTLMVPKEQYVRASGMISLAQSASGIFAPVAAGALMGIIGVGGILALDLCTLSLALTALLVVYVPQPPQSELGRAARQGLLSEAGFGFRYIFSRPGLLGLQLVFLFGNLLMGFSMALSNPMILARTGNNSLILGTALSVGAIGGVAGGAFLTAWGGPKKKMNGVVIGWIGCFILGLMVWGLSRTVILWSIAAFFYNFFIPICNGANQAIWQRKVQPDVQGKVFAARLMMAQISVPLAMLVAGPFADRVVEPAMASGGSLARIFGGIAGTGPGSGMGLILAFCGLIGAFIVIGTYLSRQVRDVETILPDFDAVAKAEAGEAAAKAGGGKSAAGVEETTATKEAAATRVDAEKKGR